MNMTLLTIFQIVWHPLLTLPPPKVTIITDAVRQRYEVYYSTFIEVLSVSADLMYFYYLIDTYTDPLDETLSRNTVDIIADAILNPNKACPIGELFIGTVAQQ